LKQLEDFQSFPTICGKLNHAYVMHVKRGLQSRPENCQLLPGCT